jgi:hypothetical protein
MQMRRCYHLAVIPQPTHLVHLFWPPDGFSQPVSSLTGHPLEGRVTMAPHFDDSNYAAGILCCRRFLLVIAAVKTRAT